MMFRNTQKGFTLIELLVVISIIALLSSVVLASVGDARAKGRNAKRVQIAKQYQTALALYFEDNKKYPYPCTTSCGSISTIRYCLGEVGVGACYAGSGTGSASLNSMLSSYISGPPALTDPVGTSDYSGMGYFCTSMTGGSSGDCTSYDLRWAIEGTSYSCGGGTVQAIVGGNRVCQIIPY